MIFIVLGTQKFQCNRLLQEMDKIIERGLISDRVIAQIGNSDYIPKNYSYFTFLCNDEFNKYIKSCDLLITHSGVGTIIKGITSDKPVIVFPRLSKYKEHIDDHQLEIAIAFSRCNYVLMCGEDDDLYSKVIEAYQHRFEKYTSQRQYVIQVIEKFIRENN